MQDLNEQGLNAAIGRSESRTARLDRQTAERLAATLGQAAPKTHVPPGGHWLWFNPFVGRGDLGHDGHPKVGGFMPDTGLPRRMWAGGRVRYLAPLPLDAEAVKVTEIRSITEKSGKAGRLVFVTLLHRISVDGQTAIEEEQDIVYRDAPAPGSPAPKAGPAPEGATVSEGVTPDPVLLFRYSALTSNGHRIHYDAPYARDEEGYPDLVVHGPLTATLLQDFAQRSAKGRRLSGFSFRGASPLFVTAPFTLHAKPGEKPGSLQLWAATPEGGLAMQAEAEFDG